MFSELPSIVETISLIDDGEVVATFKPERGVSVWETMASAIALYRMPAQGNA